MVQEHLCLKEKLYFHTHEKEHETGTLGVLRIYTLFLGFFWGEGIEAGFFFCVCV